MRNEATVQKLVMMEEGRTACVFTMRPNKDGTAIHIEHDLDYSAFFIVRSLLMATHALAESAVLKEEIKKWVDRMDEVDFEDQRREVVKRLAQLIEEDEPARDGGEQLPF